MGLIFKLGKVIFNLFKPKNPKNKAQNIKDEPDYLSFSDPKK